MQNRQTFIGSVKQQVENNQHIETTDRIRRSFTQLQADAEKQYANLDLARNRAAFIRWRAIENLDKYLVDFEASFMRNGGRVIWAYDAQNALQEIDQIIRKNADSKVYLSKSKHAQEIQLNAFLQDKKIPHRIINTSDFLVKANGAEGTHPIHSSVMLNRTDIVNELNKQIKVSMNAPDDEILRDIRQVQHETDISEHAISVFSADFLVAENGTVVCSDPEAGIQHAVNLSRTQIILAGIDSIIPSFNDAEVLLSLYSTYAYGQESIPYQTYYNPRKSENDRDIPIEMIIILLDNGRSEVLTQQDQRQILRCIDCGACHFECPVYRISGGSVYGNAHETGPNGTVRTHIINGWSQAKHYGDFCTSCAACTVVCPVHIDVHTQILRNRRETAQEGVLGAGGKMVWYAWKKAVLSRKYMDKSDTIKNLLLKQTFKTEWGPKRILPKIQERSFNQQWRERKGIK